MILAAGRGSRLRPLTDHTPKPLVQVGTDPRDTLIDARLRACRAAGIQTVVINTAWLGAQIVDAIGDGSAWEVQVQYSHEGDTGLETGGGLKRALPLLGSAPFVVTNADVWTDFDVRRLVTVAEQWPGGHAGRLAHLVLVDNPPWRPRGEFDLTDAGGGEVRVIRGERYTLAGLHVIAPELLAGDHPDAFSVVPLLFEAIDAGHVTGERLTGHWSDIGTPDRLEELRTALSN